MNDKRADQLKQALRHRMSNPVSDAVRHREMNQVRNYDRVQQQKVFDNERKQANAYQQERKDPDAKDVGSSFKLQVYISKLNQLLTNKSDIYQQLILALPTMTTPAKLRGATAEAKGANNFLSKGEIEGAYNEMVAFITSYFGDINLDGSIRDAIYQQYLTPFVANLRQTATLYPRFYEAIPAGQARQAAFIAARLSIKNDAEDTYAMLRAMAENIEDGIYRPINNSDITNIKERESVDQLFNAVQAGADVDIAQVQLMPQPPAPVGPQPAQAVAPPQNPPPTRDELAQGITAEEAARRALLPAYQGPPAPPAQPAPQPGLNPQAPPFQPPQGPPAQVGDPLQALGTPQIPTPERQVVLAALAAMAPARFPGAGNQAQMRVLGQQIAAQPNAAALGFDGSGRQAGLAMAAIYAQNVAAFNVRLPGSNFPGQLPGNLAGMGQPSGGSHSDNEDQNDYEEEELPPQPFMGLPQDEAGLRRIFEPQQFDAENPMMFRGSGMEANSGFYRSGLGQPSGGGFWGSLASNLMSPGTAALSYLTTGKSVYDNIMGSGSAIIPNRGVAGGCASCDGENKGGARHRRPPTKRHLIGGLPQGIQSRIDMINPDNEIMDAGTLRMKGLGKVGGATSDQLLQARGIMNTPYPDQPFYGYGVDGDEDESQNLSGLKARLNGGITFGAGRNHRTDPYLTYEPVADDVYENTGAEEELAGEGHFRDEYEEPKDMDDDPNPFRVRNENYRIATGKQKRPTYNYVKA